MRTTRSNASSRWAASSGSTGGRSRILLLAAVILVPGLSACDDGFQPYDNEGNGYVISGFLDAAADTQWIRIMPLRETVAYTSTGPLDATVTVEGLDDGRIITLRDSLFTHQPAVFLEGAGLTYTHNFWTTEKILPGARYKLVIAGKNGGITAEATVTIPRDYKVTFEVPYPRSAVIAEVEGVKLEMVLSRYDSDCPPWSLYQYHLDVRHPVPEPVNGVYRVSLRGDGSLPPSCARPPAYTMIVPADIDWPIPSELGWAYPNLHRETNLTNAVGLFAGVFTKKFSSYPTCALTPPTEPCRIVPVVASSRLVGMVIDEECDTPVVGGQLSMVYIPTDPRVRVPDRASSTEKYIFGALTPGRYILTARHTRLRMVEPPFSRARSSAAAARSTPTTLSPRRASAITRSPVPQPTSSTRPAGGGYSSSNEIRSGCGPSTSHGAGPV